MSPGALGDGHELGLLPVPLESQPGAEGANGPVRRRANVVMHRAGVDHRGKLAVDLWTSSRPELALSRCQRRK